jgi:hypothetical protein
LPKRSSCCTSAYTMSSQPTPDLSELFTEHSLWEIYRKSRPYSAIVSTRSTDHRRDSPITFFFYHSLCLPLRKTSWFELSRSVRLLANAGIRSTEQSSAS